MSPKTLDYQFFSLMSAAVVIAAAAAANQDDNDDDPQASASIVVVVEEHNDPFLRAFTLSVAATRRGRLWQCVGIRAIL